MTEQVVLSETSQMSETSEREYANQLYLADVFGDVITSGNNKNIICLIEAKPGQGKSWTALSIASACSVHLAQKLGGKPWEYFNINHVGIIMPDKMVEVIANMRKYGVYILDDAGMAYSSRKWQSAGNEAMNNMLQTMRTDNNIIILTVPDSDWIDKIGRNILHFKIVMKQPLHSIGYSLGRLVTVEKMYNSTNRKNLFPYLKLPDKIYNYALFPKPHEPLAVEYERRRSIELERLKTISQDGMSESVKEFLGEVEKDKVKHTKEQTDLDKAFAVHEMSVTKGFTIREACKLLKINKDKYYQIRKKNPEMFGLSV